MSDHKTKLLQRAAELQSGHVWVYKTRWLLALGACSFALTLSLTLLLAAVIP